jgi:cytochrome c
MKLLMGTIAAVAVMLTSQAFAATKVDMAGGLTLAQKSGCTACHSVDKKIVGPAFKDVSAKYKGNKKAHDMLVAKVTKGGSGVWCSTNATQWQSRSSRHENPGNMGFSTISQL